MLPEVFDSFIAFLKSTYVLGENVFTDQQAYHLARLVQNIVYSLYVCSFCAQMYTILIQQKFPIKLFPFTSFSFSVMRRSNEYVVVTETLPNRTIF